MRDIARVYATRGALVAGSEVFVGRTRTAADIVRRLANPRTNLIGVALVGPRRTGKSSLLQQLTHMPFRAQFADGAEDWVVAHLEMAAERWTGIARFRRRVAEVLARGVGLSVDEVWKEDHALDQSVEEILRRVPGRTVLLLLDQFQAVAAELDREDQTAFRAALEGERMGRFSIIMAVERSPDELLEFVPNVVKSQLAGVVNVAVPPLGGLTEREARRLVGVGRTLHGLEPDPDAEEWLMDRVGRHPALLHAACYAWYAVAAERRWAELSFAERQDADAAIRTEVAPQWAQLLPALPSDLRAHLRHPSPEPLAPRLTQHLTELGVERFVATYLGLGEAQSSGPILSLPIGAEAWHSPEPVERLIQAVEDLNHSQQVSTGRPERLFRVGDLSTSDRVLIGRTSRRKQDCSESVRGLALLLYDGTNGAVAPEERGVCKPTLPRWCYQDCRSVIVQVIAWRNHLMHLSAQTPTIQAEHLAVIRQLCQLYAGCDAPTRPEDWDRIRTGLVVASGDFVIRLQKFVPVDKHLTEEAFFDSAADTA